VNEVSSRKVHNNAFVRCHWVFSSSPPSPEVSVLIVGLFYGARNLLSYTRRMMQNFLSFRDSPIIPLRCSPPAFLASRSKAALNERFEQSEGRKSKYGSNDVDLHFDPEMGVSFCKSFPRSIDQSIQHRHLSGSNEMALVLHSFLLPLPRQCWQATLGAAWDTGRCTVGLPFNCDIL